MKSEHQLNRTADLVVVGMTDAAAAAATDGARRGKHVLIVGESQNACYRRGLRRMLDAAGAGCRERVSILAGFEVVSVDGVGAVEVVLIRKVRTGHLIGINTGAMLATTALAPGVVFATFQNPSDGTPPG
jgi:thioredoxin reductase